MQLLLSYRQCCELDVSDIEAIDDTEEEAGPSGIAFLTTPSQNLTNSLSTSSSALTHEKMG